MSVSVHSRQSGAANGLSFVTESVGASGRKHWPQMVADFSASQRRSSSLVQRLRMRQLSVTDWRNGWEIGTPARASVIRYALRARWRRVAVTARVLRTWVLHQNPTDPREASLRTLALEHEPRERNAWVRLRAAPIVAVHVGDAVGEEVSIRPSLVWSAFLGGVNGRRTLRGRFRDFPRRFGTFASLLFAYCPTWAIQQPA
jgi:hypothetical protein